MGTMKSAIFADVSKVRMNAAFELVCPRARAEQLAARGIIPLLVARQRTWRDEIAEIVTDEMLAAAGVTIEDVREAVEFFTATSPTITRERVGSLPWVSYLGGVDGWLVIADGYRRGPAGDH